MAWTVRSVSPTTALISRIRASGLRAISTSTCPCPVSRVQLPPIEPGSVIPPDHILTREFTREETHEIFLVFLLTGIGTRADPDSAPIGARPLEVMQMPELGFPVETVSGVPVVSAPAEIDVTNVAGLRAALGHAAGNGHGTLVVDLTRTQFCDSAGMHALVDAHKRAWAEGGQVLLAVSGAAVPRILEITGIDRVLPRFDSVAEALACIPVAETPGPPPG
jgi:anti-sigma B factor antagonist